MENNDFIKTINDPDILLTPHQGRESGYNTDFINTVNPRLTIVSDGKHCDTSGNKKYSEKSRGWTPALANIILAIGFPFVIIFLWIFDVSLKGIEKTEPFDSVTIQKGDESKPDSFSRFENFVI